MANRSGAKHVTTTSRRVGDKVYETVLLRRSYREDGKVKHQTLANLSHLHPSLIDIIRNHYKGEPTTLGGDPAILRSLPHGHIAAILGTMHTIGLDSLLSSRPCPERDRVLAMIAARVGSPDSKLATARDLRDETATSTLGSELGLGTISEDELYAAMDWLLARQTRIENKLAKKHLQDGTLVLYDVSASAYTGTHCPLAKHGYSRDHRRDLPQIVYGLLCAPTGCPLAIEVFTGNTADPLTLGVQIDKLKKRFGLAQVVLVGDRGMITSKRIEDELRPAGIDWITALRSESIRALVEQDGIQATLFDEWGLAEVTSEDYPGERLVVCKNPFLADKRAVAREELLVATEKQLEKIALATRRAKRPLRGEAAIGERVGRVIGRHKMGKHFIREITAEGFSYRRDAASIAREAQLDGLYVVRTSLPAEAMGSEDVVRSYKDLSKVERAFRSLKTVDLKVRPIRHRTEERVRAHIFLCMLAYYVEWHMRQALAPILYDDHEREEAAAARVNVVMPAQRSAAATQKDRRGRTEDGLPVQSFQSLLRDLSTLTKNRMQIAGQEFDLLSTPTATQSEAFRLLTLTP